MLLCTLVNITLMVVIFLPLISGASTSMDFEETEKFNLILNLVEGSELNYSAEVEIPSLQSIYYACVTKNLSATLILMSLICMFL